MVYILAQRLSAQNVAVDKSKRVLQDVVRTMYNPIFVQELFRPQEVYTMQSTRQIFDRLAHSSIMRLNESSMDKLYDLISMGFKYQTLASNYPQELLHVTLNHLYQLRAKVEDAPAVAALIDDAIRLVNEKYAAMSALEFALLKQTLCRFFADKKVKVSLFLQDGLQKNDGAITLQYSGPLPPGVELPIKMTQYDISGAPLGVDSLAFPDGHLISEERLGQPVALARGRACKLGLNLYSKEAPAPPPAGMAAETQAVANSAAARGPARKQVDSVAAERAILEGSHAAHTSNDLNILANLIGTGGGGGGGGGLEFKLNLFPDVSGGGAGGGGGGGGGGVPTIQIDAGRSIASSNRDLLGVMNEMNLDEQGGAGAFADDDPDDLLGLLDEAGR